MVKKVSKKIILRAKAQKKLKKPKFHEIFNYKAPKKQEKSETIEDDSRGNHPSNLQIFPMVQVEKKSDNGSIGSYAKFFAIGIIIIALLWLGYTVYQNTHLQTTYIFPKLGPDTMVCDNYYVCFLENGTWYKPNYNAGADLILANNFKISGEAEIKQFFDKSHIALVFGSAPESDPKNAQLIVATSPFTYYLSHYYSTHGSKTVTPYLQGVYNGTEGAILILGPGMGANETSLTYDGKNVVVQGTSFDDLKLVLGKLLIVAIKE